MNGQITASRAWQPKASGAVDGFIDEGRVTSSPEWMIRKARTLGIPPEIDAAMSVFDFGLTSDEEHAALREVIGVETDAQFWARTRAARPRGDALARMALARAA